MSVSLNTAISSLISNKRRVGGLKALGVQTFGDAITYYPFRVTDPVAMLTIREATIGKAMAFAGVVDNVRISRTSNRGFRLEASVDDSDFAARFGKSGAMAKLVFFSNKKQYIDWMNSRLRWRTHLVVAGVPSEFNGQLQFTHPEILTIAPAVAEQGQTQEQHSHFPDENASKNNMPQSTGLQQSKVNAALVNLEQSKGYGSGKSGKFDAETEDEALARVCRPRPVYHANSRINSDRIHESILTILNALTYPHTDLNQTEANPAGMNPAEVSQTEASQTEASQTDSATGGAGASGAKAPGIPDILPENVRQSLQCMHRQEAIRAVHDPRSVKEFFAAITMLRYEEAFISQIAVCQSRLAIQDSASFKCAQTDSRDEFIDSLPFAITSGQKQVIHDIDVDMKHPYPMHRLLQGEVGSGKTVVAVAAMLQAVGSGYQAVLIAPTQVLAEQHHATIAKLVSAIAGEENTIPVTLLTGGMKLAARRKALAQAASGQPGIVIATHAAFSKTFQAPNLALVVIDEQHRFGVEQRESLRNKGDRVPHTLVMTATPIPRTAAMTWFGDLDVSELTELPGGRKPIRTVVVQESDFTTIAQMFSHIRNRIDSGERAYVVCPRIDETDSTAESEEENFVPNVSAIYGSARDEGSEAGDSNEPEPLPLHSVTQMAERLSGLAQFKDISIATLTGRDDDSKKQQVMADFISGKSPILVATTVIEVGVDVPSASCMVIFDAERYGLSQLHQLRGRVGRGGLQSWAFLVSRAEPDSIAQERLEIIENSLDGAEIAQADLSLRGAGDVLGDAQSGVKSGLKLLRVVVDADIITDARARAEELLQHDPMLLGEVELAGAVLDFTRGDESMITSS